KEIADLLRKHGGKTKKELNVLFDASSTGNLEAAKQAIADGADVNAKNYSKGTPLHYADNKEIAELLIAEGADVNAKDDWGRTPLDLADDETADLLREHGGKTGEELKALMPQLGFIRSPFGFTFNTIEGKTYRVESGTDLKKWNNIREIKGTGNDVKFTDMRKIYFPQHFYRVKVVE
ncbi:ankyrin repeat domain-containing protein, partial [bacterium]|nr:ankyrin repeat domain-containing protein [bacterium]